MDDEVTVGQTAPEDADTMVELTTGGTAPTPAWRSAAALTAPEIGARAYAVAVHGSRVVSTVGLLAAGASTSPVGRCPSASPSSWRPIAGCSRTGSGAPVVGLVEQWSGERGDLVQIVAGIPFFYRQLGYQYAVRGGGRRIIHPAPPVSIAEGWEVRPATPSDLADVRALPAVMQGASDLQVCFTDEIWPILLDLPHAPVVVAERDGHMGRRPASPCGRTAVHLVHAAATSGGAAGAGPPRPPATPGCPDRRNERRGSAFSAVLSTASYPLAGPPVAV